MLDENVTLVGYNSKKQAYIYPVVSILILIVAIFCFFFAEGNTKYASIVLVLVAILFLVGGVSLLKQPKVALKIFDDRYIFFYSINEEKRIDIYEVTEVHYWPAQIGLKIVFVTKQGREYFTYLLKNAKQVKKHLLDIFEEKNVNVIKRYSK